MKSLKLLAIAAAAMFGLAAGPSVAAPAGSAPGLAKAIDAQNSNANAVEKVHRRYYRHRHRHYYRPYYSYRPYYRPYYYRPYGYYPYGYRRRSGFYFGFGF